ncbi:hypothetical protein BP6252_05884 [Coleophoma cylindrospora]|uniref:PRISE-like Rossmann-fold domain-containing protein n=1 Tax=Coleophoma cylindrospora TaxID=1849047 RepID=A0A3D8RVJ7_9HELO|nr:hypothetical protein BP6252_05884 [Coleophoma cylindrospora]
MTTGVSPKSLKALVFGASGITGWAITNEALSYPTSTTFDSIVGLTSRKLSLEASGLPLDPRLELYDGLDLSRDVNSIVEYLRKIKHVESFTHVYFAAYVHSGWGEEDSEKRKEQNTKFVVNAVAALEIVCPNMEFFTFATGGKWYGFEFGDKVQRLVPVKESHPRIPAPYGDHIFYYPQIDALASLAEGKPWKFADIRPDAIVGFVPNHNPMNIAEPIGLYLSLWKSLESSPEVPFPGNESAYTHFHSDCSQDLVAKLHIFASLHPDKSAGKSFNIADVDYPVSWEMVWPGICQYFDLKGVGPLPEGQGFAGEPWARSHSDKWDIWTKDNDLRPQVLNKTCWDFMTIVTGPFAEFNRQYDIGEVRAAGFTESIDPVKSYHVAFNRMRAAKIIP